jgi:hypothetical protein
MPFSKARQTNFDALRKLNLQDRIEAISDPKMGQFLISMLSPTQAAELFPKYYIERNQNISGFLKAIPSSLSAAKQKEYEQQLQNTVSGESAGANYNAGGYRKKWQKEIDNERQRTQVTKKFETPLPQLSPEQKQAFEALKAGDIGVNDDRVKFLKNISDTDLTRAGLTRIKDDKGGVRYHYEPPQVSEDAVKKSMTSDAGERTGGSRSWRNRNPGNIEYGKFAKEHGAIGSDGRFAIFRTEEDGVNAQRQLLFNGENYRNLTLAQAINRWAPASENNVPAYISAMGADPNMRMSQFTREQQDILLANMRRHEGWKPGKSSEVDPLTQNYSQQQLEIKKRELLSQIEAGRITELAQITQPGMRAAAQELNINTPADMKQVKSQMTQSSGGFYHSTVSTVSASRQECADLSKAFNPNIGTAGTWKIERNDSGIRPGVVVATSRYNDGSGGKHAQGYHTGVAMSGVRPDGTFLLLEQANGMKPRISVMNVGNYNYNGKHPEIQGNYWAPIKGHEHEQSIEALKIGHQLASSDEQKAAIQSSLSGGVDPNNVITSNTNRVERTVAGYHNSEQMAQTAGVGLSEKTQVERKAVVQGSLSFEGGGTYHFGSGRPDDPDHPSTPLGSSEVGGLNPHHVPGGVGYEMPALNNRLDPKVGRSRNGMVIHSSGHDDLERLYSHGCISIPKSEFPAFQQEMDNFKKSHGGKAYINIMPDGRVTVTSSPAYSSDGTPLTPMSSEQAVKEIQTNQPQVVQSATQVASGDIKPLETVTQPQGPLNTPNAEALPAPASTPAAPIPEEPTATVQKPAEQPKPTAPTPERYNVNIPKFINAIKQTPDFKNNPLSWMATDSMITGGFNDDPRVKAAGVRLDEKGVMHFTKGMTPEAKEAMATFDTKSFMTKIEDKKKEDTPTQVKPKAKGGTTKVSTEEIAAYPIGGLQGDNAVVVNAQQQPLFTMNTNEAAVMNPDTKTVDVIPNQKNNQVGPQQQPDSTPVMNEFNSAIQELQKNFDDLSAKSGKMPDMDLKIPDQHNQSWLKELGHVTEIPYRNPTAHRVASRANGVETGSADNGYHFSHGNKS